jgi:hypothetical protein
MRFTDGLLRSYHSRLGLADLTPLPIQHLWCHEVRSRTAPHHPFEHLGRALRLCLPGEAFPSVGHALLTQMAKKFPILLNPDQDLFDLSHYVIFIREGHFESHVGMNNIPGPAEVYDDGYGAARECFEHHAGAVVAKCWKDENIRGSHATEDFVVADPTTELNGILDTK